jgi:hypothetical protein
MLAPLVGLLLLGAGVGVHLEQYSGLQLEDASRVLDALAHAIEKRTGVRPALDDPLWPSCQAADRCLPAIRIRTHAEDVVFVTMFGAPKKLRLIADRDPAPADSALRIELDLPRDETAWSEPLDKVASVLFPEARAPPANAANAADAKAAEIARPPPEVGLERYRRTWVALGAGALSLGVGIGFGIVSHNARRDIETIYMSNPDYESSLHRMRATGLVANILFGVAAACVIAGVVFFTADALD